MRAMNIYIFVRRVSASRVWDGFRVEVRHGAIEKKLTPILCYIKIN
jgi:hypothetical protein